MKNLIHFLFAFFLFATTMAQSSSDTIQVSKNFRTILIFPENISESIVGNEFDFIVDLPKEVGSQFNGRILKLYYDQLSEKKENYTNHTVITESGNVYDFILSASDKPNKLTWYIQPRMAITNISGNPIVPNQIKSQLDTNIEKETKPEEIKDKLPQSKKKADVLHQATKELYTKNPMEYYRLRSYYMQFDKARIKRYFSRLDNVFLWLKGVYYDEDELYFQFRIENKEGLDLDINFLKYHIATNYRNSSSNQRLAIEPKFIYKQPKTVAGKSENHFVVVFKKFALDEKKEIIVELDEESGNRNLSLKIGHEIINNPIRL